MYSAQLINRGKRFMLLGIFAVCSAPLSALAIGTGGDPGDLNGDGKVTIEDLQNTGDNNDIAFTIGKELDQPERSRLFFHLPGDLNGDGFVNKFDLAWLGATFGSQIGDRTYEPRADENGDGKIDFDDVSSLLSLAFDPGQNLGSCVVSGQEESKKSLADRVKTYLVSQNYAVKKVAVTLANHGPAGVKSYTNLNALGLGFSIVADKQVLKLDTANLSEERPIEIGCSFQTPVNIRVTAIPPGASKPSKLVIQDKIWVRGSVK